MTLAERIDGRAHALLQALRQTAEHAWPFRLRVVLVVMAFHVAPPVPCLKPILTTLLPRSESQCKCSAKLCTFLTKRSYRNNLATVEIRLCVAGFRITGADGHCRNAL